MRDLEIRLMLPGQHLLSNKVRIVFAESLACGTPVIACPTGALPEIVRSGQEGFLITTAEEGSAAVRRLGEIDRAACRDRAERHFSVDAVAGRYVELYRGAV
jgi:glycosyltransferase involved in cell wall biosynthesis